MKKYKVELTQAQLHTLYGLLDHNLLELDEMMAGPKKECIMMLHYRDIRRERRQLLDLISTELREINKEGGGRYA